MKKKASKALLIEFQRLGGIDSSDNPLINTCQEIFQYRAPIIIQRNVQIQDSTSSSDEEVLGLRLHQMYCKDKK